VVLLGLGGGAPDIIAVYSQVKNQAYAQTFGFIVGTNSRDTKMYSSNLGACMLVGVFMVGIVTLTKETSVKKMPFLM
jgi:hypothetical protein